jgi:protein-disulfide isomerase
MDRRGFLSGLALACLVRRGEAAEELSVLPEGVAPAKAPGLSWAGSGPAAIEVFDYNCPYCRAVFEVLDARVARAGALRLGLIDSPQLSIGSIQAAKLRQAALKIYGPGRAYAFHRRVFAHRGAIDGETGLAAAREMGFDAMKLTEVADSDAVRDVLVAQSRFLNRAGVQATPAFIIGGKILSGWPGAEGFDAALKSRGG